MSGSDEYAYNIDQNYAFGIANSSGGNEDPNAITAWQVDSLCGRTTCNANPIVGSVGVLSWVLQVDKQTTEELKCEDADKVIAAMNSLVNSNDSSAFKTYQQQLAEEYQATEVDPVDESWTEF